MKRATFTLPSGNEAQGWQSGVPGLVLRRWPERSYGTWHIYHEPSGRRVSEVRVKWYRTREEARQACERLRSVLDWTLPEEEFFQLPPDVVQKVNKALAAREE